MKRSLVQGAAPSSPASFNVSRKHGHEHPLYESNSPNARFFRTFEVKP